MFAKARLVHSVLAVALALYPSAYAGAQAAPTAAAPSGPSAGYPIPYALPTEASISEILHRILRFANAAMPTRVLDRSTNKEITDFSVPNRNAVLDRGESNSFSPLDYTIGVVHSGMLAAADATGDAAFKDFTARHMQFIHDRLDYFRTQSEKFGAERNPFAGILKPDSLDSCGSMCAALIKARRAQVGPDLMPVIEHWAAYIHTQQFRLKDGTLARQRPQAESVWADDMYMGIPALAQLGKLTGNSVYYDDAARQIVQFAGHLFNREKGLYMHGRNLNQPENPEFYWGRGNGWAMLATVEVLDVLPEDHPRHAEILALLRAQIKAVAPLQSGRGLWHQLLDKPDSYLETSASAMFVYAIAHAIDKGWISPVSYGTIAQAGWNGLTAIVNEKGQVEGTCVATTFASDNVYYYARPTSVDASHGYGPVLLAGAEMIHLLKNPAFDIKFQNNTYNYVPKP